MGKAKVKFKAKKRPKANAAKGGIFKQKVYVIAHVNKPGRR